MKTLIILLALCSTASAECIVNKDGDNICTEGNITYEYPSEKTLSKRALEQAQAQSIIDAKKASNEAIEKEKQEALEELIQERINLKKNK